MWDKDISKPNKNEDTPGEGITEMSNSSCSKSNNLVENTSAKPDKVVVATYVFNEDDECADNKSEESRQKKDIDHLLSIEDDASEGLTKSSEQTNILQNVQKSVETDPVQALKASVSTAPNTFKTAELSVTIDCNELPYKNVYTNLHIQTSKPSSKPAISVKHFSPILPNQTLQNETVSVSNNTTETDKQSKDLISDNVAGPQSNTCSLSVEQRVHVARVRSPTGSVEDLPSVSEIRACSPTPSSVTTASTFRTARSASGRRVECSRHIRRPPKEPEEYVEALFPHIQRAHNQIRQALLHAPHTDVKDNALLKRKMLEIIQLYSNGCKSEFERAVTSLVLCRRLKRNIMRLLDLFHDICLSCREDHAYLYYISQIIGVYNSLEIRLSFSMTRLQKCALIHRIVHVINKHLIVKDESLAKENILRMFLHMPDLYSARFIMEPIFNTFLQEIPTSSNTWCQKELPDKTFVQYIIILHLWKEMLRDPLEQVELINRAQHFMCPTKTLHANPMYTNHLPTIHTRKHAVKDILNSLKFFHDLRNAAICDDTLHDGDDTIEVVIDEVINTPFWDFGATYQSETKDQRHIKSRVSAIESADCVDLTIEDDEEYDTESPDNYLTWLIELKEKAAERVNHDESEKVICLDSDSEGELFSGSILDPAESYQDCDAFDTDYTSLDSSASDDRVPSDEEILQSTAITNNGLRTYLTPKSKTQVTSYEDKRTATCQRSYERSRDGDGEGDRTTVGGKSTTTSTFTETGLPLILNSFTVRGKQNLHLLKSPRYSLEIGPERFGYESLDDTCNEGRGTSRNVMQKHDRAKSSKTYFNRNTDVHGGRGSSRGGIASHEKDLNAEADTDEDDEDDYHSLPLTASSSATTLGKVIYSQALSPSKHRFSSANANAEHEKRYKYLDKKNMDSRKHLQAEDKPTKKQVKFNDNPIGPTRRPHTKLPIKPAIHLSKIQPSNQPRVFSNSPQPRFASPSSSTSSTTESLKQMAQKGRSFVVKSKSQESKNLPKTSSSIIIDTDDDDNNDEDDIILVNASINIRKNPLKLSTQPIQSKKTHKKGITNQQLSLCNSNICTNTGSVLNRTINMSHGPKDISSTNYLRNKSVDIIHRAEHDDNDDDNNKNGVDKEVKGEAHVSNASTIRNNIGILEVEKRIEMEEQNSNVSTTTGPNIDWTVDIESVVDRPVAAVSDRCTVTVESTSTEEYESIPTSETHISTDICTSSTGANMQDLLETREVSENNAELSNTPVLFSVPLNIEQVNRRDDIYIAIADQQKGDEAVSNACIEFASDKIISANKSSLNATCNVVDKPTGIESVYGSEDANKKEENMEGNTNEGEKTGNVKEAETANDMPQITVTQNETVSAVNQEYVKEVEQESAETPIEISLAKLNEINLVNQVESQEACLEIEETAGKYCNDLDGLESAVLTGPNDSGEENAPSSVNTTTVKEKYLSDMNISASEEYEETEENNEINLKKSLQETVNHNPTASDNIEVQSSEKANNGAEVIAINVENSPNKEGTILAESKTPQEANLNILEISTNTGNTNQIIKDIQESKEETMSSTEINLTERNLENVIIVNLLTNTSIDAQGESTGPHTAEVNKQAETNLACDSIDKSQLNIMPEGSMPLPEVSANQKKSADSETNIEKQLNATESSLEMKCGNVLVRREIPNVPEENIKTEKLLDTNTDEIQNNGNDYKPIEEIDRRQETTASTSAALTDNMTAHKEIFKAGGTTNTTNDGLVCLVAAVKAVEALTSNTFSSENVEDNEMGSVSGLKVHKGNGKSENATDSRVLQEGSAKTNKEPTESALDVVEKSSEQPMPRIQVMTVVAAKTSSAVSRSNIYFSGDKSPQTNLERLAEAVLLSEAAAKKNCSVLKKAYVPESVDISTKNARKRLNIALAKSVTEKIASREHLNIISSMSNLNESAVYETIELAATELTSLKNTTPTLVVESLNVETVTCESLPHKVSSISQIPTQEHEKITQVSKSFHCDTQINKVGDNIETKERERVENSCPITKGAAAKNVKRVKTKSSMLTQPLTNKTDESLMHGSQENSCGKLETTSEISSIAVPAKTGSTFLSSFEYFINTLKDPPPRKAEMGAPRRSPRTPKIVGKQLVCGKTPNNKEADLKTKQISEVTLSKDANTASTTPKNITSTALQSPEFSVSVSDSENSRFEVEKMQVRKRYSLRKTEQWKVVKNTGLRTSPPTSIGESLSYKKSAATNVISKRCIKIRLARAKVPTKAEKKEFLPLPEATTVDNLETQFGDMSHRPITRKLAAALNSSLQMETENAVIEPIKPFIEGARKNKPKMCINTKSEQPMAHKRRKCINTPDTLNEKTAYESNSTGKHMFHRENMNTFVKGKRKYTPAETATERCKEPIKSAKRFEKEHNNDRVETLAEGIPCLPAKSSPKRAKTIIPKKVVRSSEKGKTVTKQNAQQDTTPIFETVISKPCASTTDILITKINSMENTEIEGHAEAPAELNNEVLPKQNCNDQLNSLPLDGNIPREGSPSAEYTKLNDTEPDTSKKDFTVEKVTVSVVNKQNSTMKKLRVCGESSSAEMYDAKDNIPIESSANENIPTIDEMSKTTEENVKTKITSNNTLQSAETGGEDASYKQKSESSLEAMHVESSSSNETGSSNEIGEKNSVIPETNYEHSMKVLPSDISNEKICCEKSVGIDASVLQTLHNVSLLKENSITDAHTTDVRSTESEEILAANFHEDSNSLPESNEPSRLLDISSFSSLTLDESYDTAKSVIKCSTKQTANLRYDIEFLDEDSNINMSISHIEINDKNEEPNDIVSINTLKTNMEADKLLEEYNHSTRIIANANANLKAPTAVQTPTDGRTPACSSVTFSYTGSDSSSSFTNSCSCSTTSTINSATDLYKNEPTSFKVVQSQAQVVELLSSTNTSFQDLSLLDLEHDVIINHDELLSELMPTTEMEHNYAIKPLEISVSNEYDTHLQEKEDTWPCHADERSDNNSSGSSAEIVTSPNKEIPPASASLKVSIPIAYIKRLDAITENASKNWYLSEKPSTSKAALAALAKRNAQLGIDTMFTGTPHARKRNVTDHTESRHLKVRDPSPSLPLKKRRNLSGAPEEDVCSAAVILYDDCALVNKGKKTAKEIAMHEIKTNLSEINHNEILGFQNTKDGEQNIKVEQYIENPKRIVEHLNETVCNVENGLDGENSGIIDEPEQSEENELINFQDDISAEKKALTATSNNSENSLGRDFAKGNADECTDGTYLLQQVLVDCRDNEIEEQKCKKEAAVTTIQKTLVPEENSNLSDVQKTLQEQRKENSDEHEPSRNHEHPMDITVPQKRTVETDVEVNTGEESKNRNEVSFNITNINLNKDYTSRTETIYEYERKAENDPTERVSDTTERQSIQPQQHSKESAELQNDAENQEEIQSPVNTKQSTEATYNTEVVDTVQDQNANPTAEWEANGSACNSVAKELTSAKEYVIGETFVGTNVKDVTEINGDNLAQVKETRRNITVLEIPKSLVKYFETPDEESLEGDPKGEQNSSEDILQCEENEAAIAQEGDSNEETQQQYTLNMFTNGISNEVIIKITQGQSEKETTAKSKANIDNSNRDLLQDASVNLATNDLEKEAGEASTLQREETTAHQLTEVLQNCEQNFTLTNKTENEGNSNNIQCEEIAQNRSEHVTNKDNIASALVPQAEEAQLTEMTTVQQLLVPDHRGLTLTEACYTAQANDDATANCADNTSSAASTEIQAQNMQNYISIPQDHGKESELLNFDDQANETILTNYEDQFFVPGCLNDSVSGFQDAANNMFPSNVYAENDFDIANNIIIRTQEIKEESMDYMSNIGSPKNSPINLTTSVPGFTNATDLGADLLKSNDFIDLTANLTNSDAASNSIDYQLFTIGSDIRTSFPSAHITTMPTSAHDTLCVTLPHSQTVSSDLNVNDTPTIQNYGFDVEEHDVGHRPSSQDLTQMAELGFVVERMQTPTEAQLPEMRMQTVQVQGYTNFAQTLNHGLTPEQKIDTTTEFVAMKSPISISSNMGTIKPVRPIQVVPMADAHEAQPIEPSTLKICSTSQSTQPASQDNERIFGMEHNLTTTTTEMTTNSTYVPQHLTQPSTLSPILPLIKPTTTATLTSSSSSSSSNENTNEMFSFNDLETNTTQITHMPVCTMASLTENSAIIESFTTTTTSSIADNDTTTACATTSSTNTETGEENSTTSVKAQNSTTQPAELTRGITTTRTRAPARVQIVAPQRKSRDFPPKTSEDPKTPESIFTNTTAAFCNAIEYNTNQIVASLPHTYPTTSPTQCSNSLRFEKYIQQLATFMDVSGIIASTPQHVCVDKKDWAAAHLALFTQASPLASVLLIKPHDDGTMSIYFDSEESIVLTAEMVKLVNRLSLGLIILQKRQTPVLGMRELLKKLTQVASKTIYRTTVNANALEQYDDGVCTIGNKQQLQQMQPLINPNVQNIQMYTGNWKIEDSENALTLMPSNAPTIRMENEQLQQQLNSADTLPLQVDGGGFVNYEQPIAFTLDDNSTTILTTNATLSAQPYEQVAFHATLADSDAEKNYNWTEAEQIGLLNWQQEAVVPQPPPSSSTELNQHQAHPSSVDTSLFNEQTVNSNIEDAASDYMVENNEDLHTVFTVSDVPNDMSTTEAQNITHNVAQSHNAFIDTVTKPKCPRQKRATIKRTPIKKSNAPPKVRKDVGKSLEKSTPKQRINKRAPISVAVKPQQHIEKPVEPTRMQHNNSPSTTHGGSAIIHYRHNAPPQVGGIPNQHTATLHYKQPVAGVPAHQGLQQPQQQQQSLYNTLPQPSTPYSSSTAGNHLIQTIPLINIENLKNIQLLSQQPTQNSTLYAAAGQGNTVRYLITTPHTHTATLPNNNPASNMPTQIPHIAYSYQMPQHFGDNSQQSHTNAKAQSQNTKYELQANERGIDTDMVVTTSAPPSDASLLRKVRRSRPPASNPMPKLTPNSDSATTSDGVLMTELPTLTPSHVIQQQFLQTSQTDMMSNNRVEHYRNSQNLVQSTQQQQQQQQGLNNIRAEEDERMYMKITRISTPTPNPPEEHKQQHDVLNQQQLPQLPILTVTTQRQSILTQDKLPPRSGKAVKKITKHLMPTAFAPMAAKLPNPTRKRGRPRKGLTNHDDGTSDLIKMRSAYETAQKFAKLRESVNISSVTRVPTPLPPQQQEEGREQLQKEQRQQHQKPPTQSMFSRQMSVLEKQQQQQQQQNEQQLLEQQHQQHEQLETSSFISAEQAFNMPEHMFSSVDGQNVVLAGEQEQQQDLQSHSHSHMPPSPAVNQKAARNV